MSGSELFWIVVAVGSIWLFGKMTVYVIDIAQTLTRLANIADAEYELHRSEFLGRDLTKDIIDKEPPF